MKGMRYEGVDCIMIKYILTRNATSIPLLHMGNVRAILGMPSRCLPSMGNAVPVQLTSMSSSM
jgi:hypothetical protein